jgi:hypothetical protein
VLAPPLSTNLADVRPAIRLSNNTVQHSILALVASRSSSQFHLRQRMMNRTLLMTDRIADAANTDYARREATRWREKVINIHADRLH